MSSASSFAVLLTKNLTQKRKVWSNGHLRVSRDGRKWLLFDECDAVVDSIPFRSADAFDVAAEIRFGQHLVEVVSLDCTPSAAATASTAPHAPVVAAVAASSAAASLTAPPRLGNFRPPMLKRPSSASAVVPASVPVPVPVGVPASGDSASGAASGRSNDDILRALLGGGSGSGENVVPNPTPTPTPAVDHPKTAAFVAPAAKRQRFDSTSSVSTPMIVRPSASALAWNHASIAWPTAATCDWLAHQRSPTESVRKCECPERFEALPMYVSAFTLMLNEELNIRLADAASNFHVHARLAGAGDASASVVKCPKHGPAVLRTVRKEGKNLGRHFFSCRRSECDFFEWAKPVAAASKPTAAMVPWAPDDAALKTMRSAGLRLHDAVEFIVSGTPPTYFLKLDGWRSADKTAYSRGDLWVVSEDASFCCGKRFLCRSVYHAPMPSGLLQVDPLDAASGAAFAKLKGAYGLHVLNASSELAMLDNLASLARYDAEGRAPLLPCLLGQATSAHDTRVSVPLQRAEIDAVADELAAKHRLNEEQREALRRVSLWFRAADDADDDAPAPADYITLVHGVFGGGKTATLVVMILLIARVGEMADDDSIRVLVSSSTNVAVDRVLLALQELGAADLFLRVGSLRKIARPILCRSVHRARDEVDEKKNADDAVKNLQEMLAAEPNMTRARRAALQQELAAVRSGAARKRLSALGSVRVVGVTCAASVFSVLDQCVFPFCLLDECSQQMEPQSGLVLSRFGVRRAALIGDPLQLPTQLHQCFGRVERKAAQRGLGRAMFSRLASSGSSVVMLKRQYRCHPALSRLSNTLFYGGELIDCAAPEHVSPLFESLPTLALYDASSGTEEITKTGSFINSAEAAVIVQLVVLLRRRGVDPAKIGIIALYKAQAVLIAEKLAELDVASVVATDADALMDDHDDAATGTPASGTAASDAAGGDSVQVATVDAFQGAEKDVVIMSTTRASYSVGFLESSERLNVALTRARRHLLIVGHRKTLETDAQWRFVVQQCADAASIRDAHETVLRNQSFV
jgi:hypothetical protein